MKLFSTSARAPEVGRGDVSDSAVFWALVALLAWAPLPLGSNRTFAVGLLVLACVGLATASAWAWRGRAELAWERLSRFRWPLVILAVWTAYIWCQTIPLPPTWLTLLSPEAARVQLHLAVPTISLDVFQTRLYAALSMAYLLCFAVVCLTVRDRRRLDRLAYAIVWIGVVYAVVGVVLFSLGASYQVFFFDVTHGDRLRGTLGYHNHFAGFMELCLSVGIGLMLARLDGSAQPVRNWKHRFVRALDFVLSPKMRLRLLLVVMVIALVLTRSRMGNTAFFAALLLVGGLSLLLTRRSAPAMVTLVISLIVVDVVVVGSWVGLEKVVQRLEQTHLTEDGGGLEESVEARAGAARHALDMVADFPLTGTGLGSFYQTYIRYRTPAVMYFDHAHNDYAEFAAETGLVGLVLLGGVVLSSFVLAGITLARRRSATPRGMAFGVMMAIVCLVFHSWTDFNLQLPSNALLLMVVLAMGWVAWALPSGRSSHDHGERRRA